MDSLLLLQLNWEISKKFKYLISNVIHANIQPQQALASLNVFSDVIGTFWANRIVPNVQKCKFA